MAANGIILFCNVSILLGIAGRFSFNDWQQLKKKKLFAPFENGNHFIQIKFVQLIQFGL